MLTSTAAEKVVFGFCAGIYTNLIQSFCKMLLFLPTSMQLLFWMFHALSHCSKDCCVASHVFVGNNFKVDQPQCGCVPATLDSNVLLLLPDNFVTKSTLCTSDGLIKKCHPSEKFRKIVIKLNAGEIDGKLINRNRFCGGRKIRSLENCLPQNINHRFLNDWDRETYKKQWKHLML